MWVSGRQTLISLKLLAARPSQRKHIDDLRALRPSQEELLEAVRFVRAYDATSPTLDDLDLVLRELGSEADYGSR